MPHVLTTSSSLPSQQIKLFICIKAKRSPTSGSQQELYDEVQQSEIQHSVNRLEISADAKFLVHVLPEHLMLLDQLFWKVGSGTVSAGLKTS